MSCTSKWMNSLSILTVSIFLASILAVVPACSDDEGADSTTDVGIDESADVDGANGNGNDDTGPVGDSAQINDASSPGSDASSPGSDADSQVSDAGSPGSDVDNQVSDVDNQGSDADNQGSDADNQTNGVDFTDTAYVAFVEELCEVGPGGVEWCYEAESLDHNLWKQSVVVAEGGHLYVGGDGIEPESPITEVDSGAVCRVDENGVEQWCVDFEDGVDDLAVDAGGDIYVPIGASVTDFDDSALCKLDDQGDEQWCANLDFRPRAVAVTDDGDEVYVGGFLDTICRFDDEGDEQWCHSDYDSSPQTMTLTDAGELFVGFGGGVISNAEVCRVDAQGDKSGCFELHGGGLNSLESDAASDLYVGLHDEEDNPCKLADDGEEVWCAPGERSVESLATVANGTLFAAQEAAVVQYDDNGEEIGRLQRLGAMDVAAAPE